MPFESLKAKPSNLTFFLNHKVSKKDIGVMNLPHLDLGYARWNAN